MKVLKENVDFTIEQKRVIMEYFVWKCPECGKDHRDREDLVVPDKELYCSDCKTSFKYEWAT